MKTLFGSSSFENNAHSGAGGPCSIMFPTIIRRQEGKIIPNNDKRGNKVASSLIKLSYRGRKSLSSQIILKEFGGRQARVYIKNRIANNPVSQCSGFGRPDGRVGRAEVRSPFQSSRSRSLTPPSREGYSKHFCLPPAPHPSRGGLQRQRWRLGHSLSPRQHQEVAEVNTDPA